MRTYKARRHGRTYQVKISTPHNEVCSLAKRFGFTQFETAKRVHRIELWYNWDDIKLDRKGLIKRFTDTEAGL